MDIVDIRSKSSEDLLLIIRKLREEFVRLVFQKKTGRLNNTAQFKVISKSIARVLTVLKEREADKKDV
ncbi:50S ribosomal protein L29 [Wolbachia endosymbiont of Pentidionis agamae]|uniref:50S ribosomal protein L29 n=1 Tax=Wolbachia endosymbiont of Pentidionis agamae TaxID=3110435 RepID=UPI002FD269AD